MVKPHGYVTCVGGYQDLEHDSIICGHCNRIVLVKAGSASTVYVFYQLTGPPKEEPGAHCAICDKPICLTCYDKRVCLPLMKKIEQMEARGRLLKAVGV